jgi:hypothetical protein
LKLRQLLKLHLHQKPPLLLMLLHLLQKLHLQKLLNNL